MICLSLRRSHVSVGAFGQNENFSKGRLVQTTFFCVKYVQKSTKYRIIIDGQWNL